MKFFSTFISVGILMIFGTLLGIQLDGQQDSYSQNVVTQTTESSNIVENVDDEETPVETHTEPKTTKDSKTFAEKSVLTKLGQGLNNVVSGISEKCVSGLE